MPEVQGAELQQWRIDKLEERFEKKIEDLSNELEAAESRIKVLEDSERELAVLKKHFKRAIGAFITLLTAIPIGFEILRWLGVIGGGG